MQGLNARVSIWSYYNDEDDVVGGAQPTGTLVYSDVGARLEPVPSSLMPTATGYETARLYNVILWPTDLVINENYEVVVDSPPSHPLYSGTFQVIEVSHDSLYGPDAHIELLTRRIVESR